MSEQERPDIRTLQKEAFTSVHKLLNHVQLNAQEVLRLGMFFGTISRYMPILEQVEREDTNRE